MSLVLLRGATAGKAPKAWALPRFWVSILTCKKQPVKKIWGRILGPAWLKFTVVPLREVEGWNCNHTVVRLQKNSCTGLNISVLGSVLKGCINLMHRRFIFYAKVQRGLRIQDPFKISAYSPQGKKLYVCIHNQIYLAYA